MLALAALAVVLAACTSVPEELRYRDPDLPPEKVAILETHSFVGFMNWVSIEHVDGKDIARMTRWEQIVELLPGKHEIGAEYVHNHGLLTTADDHFRTSIPVTVEAGHRYRIRARKAGERVRIWLEDVENEAVIGVGTVVHASGK